MSRYKPKTKFSDKWSAEIQAHGFTEVPNLLIEYQGQLGITTTEMCVLVAILKFQWDERNPYPSIARLAKNIGKSSITITRRITTLQNKGLIERRERPGRTSEYVITDKLKVKLNNIWREDMLNNQKRRGGMPKSDTPTASKMTDEEYTSEKNSLKTVEPPISEKPLGHGYLMAKQKAEELKLRIANKRDKK